LQCFHEGDDLSESAILTSIDSSDQRIYCDIPSDRLSGIECPDPVCPIESMGQAPSPSRPLNVTRGVGVNVADSLGLRATSVKTKDALWLRTVFDTFPVSPPRNLSISILRI
jgi:hypothetical protein